MKRTIVFLILGVIQIQCCSPGLNWKPSTVQDQALLAGVVFEGTVTQETDIQEDWNYVATVSNVNYYKSCGPSEVKVKGFRSSAACGVDLPGIGTKIVVFGCKEEGSEIFTLNEINIHTGALIYTDQKDQEIKKSLKIQQTLPGGQCGNEFYYKCQKQFLDKENQDNLCDDELYSFNNLI